MAETRNDSRAFSHEAPRLIQAGDPHYSLMKRVVEWVEDGSRCTSGPWVAGINGPRGSGKTSFLMSVAHELFLKNDAATKDRPPRQPRIRMPLEQSFTDTNGSETRLYKHLEACLFRADRSRNEDDLLLMLVDHLARYNGEGAQTHIDHICNRETIRKDLDRYMRYQEEISTSEKDLVRRHSILGTAGRGLECRH